MEHPPEEEPRELPVFPEVRFTEVDGETVAYFDAEQLGVIEDYTLTAEANTAYAGDLHLALQERVATIEALVEAGVLTEEEAMLYQEALEEQLRQAFLERWLYRFLLLGALGLAL